MVTTYCGRFSLVGGHNSFGVRATMTKTYKNLPSHYRLSIKAQLFQISSWDNESFFVLVDGVRVATYQTNLNNHPVYWCGTEYGWRSRSVQIDIEAAHISDSAEITFTSNLDEDAANESWGIRDFELSVVKCVDNCVVISDEFQEEEFSDKDVSGWTFDRNYGI